MGAKRKGKAALSAVVSLKIPASAVSWIDSAAQIADSSRADWLRARCLEGLSSAAVTKASGAKTAVSFRCTASELAKLEKWAKAKGTGVSDWCRTRVLQGLRKREPETLSMLEDVLDRTSSAKRVAQAAISACTELALDTDTEAVMVGALTRQLDPIFEKLRATALDMKKRRRMVRGLEKVLDIES